MPVVISTVDSTTATSPRFLRLSQHIAPAAIVAAGSAFPYKDVIRGGYSKVLNAPKVFSNSPIVVCKSDFPKLSICTRSGGPRQQLHARASKEKPGSHPLAAAISVFGDPDAGLCRISGISRARKSLNPPRAYKENFFSFRLPLMTEKPEWWWRTLACVPYLIALQISDAGYYLHPLLEHYDYFGDLIFFVPGAISRLPTWFSMVYLYFAYVGIVKNKEWPHFFRYHLMMSMLLETALQIVWHVSNFMPLIHYNGRFGMYYWAGVGFAYILILLQCVRCALAGGYAHLPFISDAAYIHTLFNIGGFQRPFK